MSEIEFLFSEMNSDEITEIFMRYPEETRKAAALIESQEFEEEVPDNHFFAGRNLYEFSIFFVSGKA